VISQTRQRFAMAGMVLMALMAFVLAAVYQDDNKLDEPTIIGGDATVNAAPSGGAGAGGGATAGGGGQVATGPIEAWLPRSGEASACSEPVGVDLAEGFGATLTINGIDIAPEAMNVNLDEEGEISSVITASRSLGHYTFEPDDKCPNGRFLRPVDNVLEVCVFRLSDNTRRCTLQDRFVFDAL
jgi:hypothetical protein